MNHPTQIRLKELFDYNDKTGVVVRKKTVRYNSKAGSIVNNATDTTYATVCVDGQRYLLHRLIWVYVYGVIPDVVDHINGNKDDNRLCNLRNGDQRQNARNSKLSKSNKSGRTGVYWNGADRVWMAQIKNDKGRCITVGRSKLMGIAIKAREDAEVFYGYHPNHGRQT